MPKKSEWTYEDVKGVLNNLPPEANPDELAALLATILDAYNLKIEHRIDILIDLLGTTMEAKMAGYDDVAKWIMAEARKADRMEGKQQSQSAPSASDMAKAKEQADNWLNEITGNARK